MLKKILIAGAAGIIVIGGAFLAAPAVAQGFGHSTVAVTVPIEKHPVLRRSINQLDRIEAALSQAPKDFSGHKEQAMDLIHKAIDQLKLAIASDRH
ncbi:MAG TPA: hypothetical protein VMI31_09080 [Fimbriimonadaceae bacterium]|nr:hypothetical protein [Fimbriimonadaceae bacterium]